MIQCSPIPEINDKLLAKIKAKSYKWEDCVFWSGCKDKDGRATIMVNYKRYKVSRLIYFITHGVDPGHKYVCHNCHQPRCIKPEHLKLDTQVGNIQDAIEQGTRFQPDNLKITDEMKAEIKLKKFFGYSVKELSILYKVCSGTIYKVLNG